MRRLVRQLGNLLWRPSNEESPRRHRDPRGGGRMRRRRQLPRKRGDRFGPPEGRSGSVGRLVERPADHHQPAAPPDQPHPVPHHPPHRHPPAPPPTPPPPPH